MKNLQTISDCFSSCTTLRNTYFKTKGIWHFSHTVPNSKNLPGLYEYSYECWYFKYVHFSLVKKPTKDPVPPTRLPQLLFSQTQFSADTNWLQKWCLKMGIYTCGNCKPYHQKKKKYIFWLTGMETESVESLLLLLSRHSPLTTHHERLSSKVNEMLSDLWRFLLSLCRSSEEFSSGHIQEFYYSKTSLQCAVFFFFFFFF